MKITCSVDEIWRLSAEEVKEVPDKDKKIIPYCHSGHAKHGYKHPFKNMVHEYMLRSSP